MSGVRTDGIAHVLHERGARSWDAAISHPMVRAIGDGTLPHETFRRYFTQNVLYLQEYARAIALIVAKAPDRGAIAVLTEFLTQIVTNEIPANLAFLDRLGGPTDAPTGAGAMHPTTYAYTRHLLTVCGLGDAAEGLTAVLPCQWSYGELARPLMSRRPEDPIYAEWIGMFGNEAYDDLVGRTTALLDELVGSADARRIATLSEIFDRSTTYEAAFWDMAYRDPFEVAVDGGGA